MKFSRLGLGCYSLTGVYGPVDPKSFTRLLQQGYHSGVTFFDTADQYGDAETVLGEALRPWRSSVIISTKVGVTNGGGRDLSPAHVKASCDASLRRLGTDYIDLYHVHFDDPRTPVAETVGALADLRAAGKIRAYGVGHLPAQRVREYMESGTITSLMLEFSAVARDTYRQAEPLARAHGTGLIAFSPTARGLLSGRFGPDTVFAPGDVRRLDAQFQGARFEAALQVVGKMRTIGREFGKSPVQVALAWVLAQDSVVTALTGPSSPEHLAENLAATEWVLPPAIKAELDQFLDSAEAALAAKRADEVRRILSQPLHADPAEAVRHLIYVMEESITLGLAAEAGILPVFHRLWAIREEPAEHLEVLSELHRKLRQIIGQE